MAALQQLLEQIDRLSQQEKAAVRAHLNSLEPQVETDQGNHPLTLLGLLADEPGLIDEIVEEAMSDREQLPFRVNH